MLVRTAVFDELGGFDTAFARDFNDVDFCLRAHQAGHRVAWTPYAHFTPLRGCHDGAGGSPTPRRPRPFRQRWSQTYPVDPLYSPALNQQPPRIYEAL